MTPAGRPFRAGKRVLSAVAAGAIAVPVSFALTGTAFATGQYPGNETALPPAAIATTTACPPSSVYNTGFNDIANDFFVTQIECLADYGVVHGENSTTYAPAGGVTRAQMAQFLYNLGLQVHGWTWNTSDQHPYTDESSIAPDEAGAVNALTNAGLVDGYTDGSYRPGNLVTRGEMSKFIYNFDAKVLGITPNSNGQDYFYDDDGNTFENPYLNGDAGIGLYVGTPGTENGLNGEAAEPNLAVRRDQMAGFVARILEQGVDNGEITNMFANVAATKVSPSSSTVAPGGTETMTVTGPNITNVSVSGPCTSGASQSNTPPSSGNSTVTVNVPISSTASAGSCTLTTTVTYTSGPKGTFTNTVTVSSTPATATNLPQLTSATVVSTTAPYQATSANPAGTVVQYTFSQPISTATASKFLLYPYNWAGTAATSCAAAGTVTTAEKIPGCMVSVSGNTASVSFPNIDYTSANAPTGTNAADVINNYTLATVQAGDVTTSTGTTNPDGSAPIGSSSTTSAGAANTTTAPDLTGVSGFRAASPDTETAVDFTFDKPAYVVNSTGFYLVPTTATSPSQDIECTGPAAGSATVANGGTPSGGTIAGGNGTTTITVVCPNPGGTTTTITSSSLARAYVAAGTVSSAASNGTENPLEAYHFGNYTPAPDLTGVSVIPANTGSNTTSSDQVLYTFDQPVTVTPGNTTGFGVFNGSATTDTGTVTSSNNNQVLVTLTTNAATQAVGAYVNGSAVSGTGTALAYTNSPDELGLTPSATSSQTPGVVDAPQLTAVHIDHTTNAFGQTSYYAAYVFNEAVTPVANNNGLFHLYNASGGAYTSPTCSVDSSNADQVDCTFTGLPSGTTDISGATLGSVTQDAVTGNTGASTPAANANPNPEGAANVS